MNKKIVLFSDGTGNSASTPDKTNVWRAYHALDVSTGSGQIAFYDNGVGTSSFTPTAVLGLAFGWGLARNVKQIYGFLCRTYNLGDKIYCFGFSRGAFTIRIVVSLIAYEGIIDRNIARDDQDLDRLIKAAYRRFRWRRFTPALLSLALAPVRDAVIGAWNKITQRTAYDPKKNLRYSETQGDDSLIKFLGVWDTVDAYGSPIDEFTRAWDMVISPLSAKNRDLSPRVDRACHALAVDEQRESFEPMLWNEQDADPPSRLDDERLSQVWFPGVHANVGGGYPDDGLAYVSLDWMLSQCEEINAQDAQGKLMTVRDGLKFISEERALIRAHARGNGPLYDSRSGIGNLYRYAPRDIQTLCHESKPGLANWLKEKLGLFRLHSRTEAGAAKNLMTRMGFHEVHSNEVNIKTPKIHHSVFDRVAQDGNAYAPINLPADYAYVDRQGNITRLAVDPGSTQPALPETKQGAVERNRLQSYVWNKVWARKLLYFATLTALIYFISLPYWAGPAGDEGEGRLAGLLMPVVGTFSVVVQQIPALIGKIPGLEFAANWAEKYQQYPFSFLSGILLIGGLLTLSLHVRHLIRAEMRRNWYGVTRSGAMQADDAGWFTTCLSGCLKSKVYTDVIVWGLRLLLEASAVLVLIIVLLVLCSRLFFVAADAAGGICGGGQPTTPAVLGEAFQFDPSDACFDTGLDLKQDKTYQIEFRLDPAKQVGGAEACKWKWRDASICADVRGWIPGLAPWYVHLATPVRRHLFASWYQPMARIDDKLLERYPLQSEGADSETSLGQLTAEITVRQRGRLYLYVNDAVIFTPDTWKAFYANNFKDSDDRFGKAWVTVRQVPDKGSR